MNRDFKYNLRHSEAVELARRERAQASMVARNCLTMNDLLAIIKKMPSNFEVSDMMDILGVSKNRAYHLIRVMRNAGLVGCKKRYRPHSGRMLLTTKT